MSSFIFKWRTGSREGFRGLQGLPLFREGGRRSQEENGGVSAGPAPAHPAAAGFCFCGAQSLKPIAVRRSATRTLAAYRRAVHAFVNVLKHQIYSVCYSTNQWSGATNLCQEIVYAWSISQDKRSRLGGRGMGRVTRVPSVNSAVLILSNFYLIFQNTNY